MQKGGFEVLREKFLKAFANIPSSVRKEDIIVVIDNEPYSWSTATIEVKNQTAIGEKILKTLSKLGLL